MARNLLETVERVQQTLSDAAKASLDRRFGALFDKVYRKDVLWQAWRLVRANHGGPGIDGQTCKYIENEIGVSVFLGELRDELRAGTYRPQPVKRCWIDKSGTTDKRPLGIPVVRDRVAQTAMKLVLEPIFETNFDQDSYGFRPGKGAFVLFQFFNSNRPNFQDVGLGVGVEVVFGMTAVQRPTASHRTKDRVQRFCQPFLNLGIFAVHGSRLWQSPNGC